MHVEIFFFTWGTNKKKDLFFLRCLDQHWFSKTTRIIKWSNISSDKTNHENLSNSALLSYFESNPWELLQFFFSFSYVFMCKVHIKIHFNYVFNYETNKASTKIYRCLDFIFNFFLWILVKMFWKPIRLPHQGYLYIYIFLDSFYTYS